MVGWLRWAYGNLRSILGVLSGACILVMMGTITIDVLLRKFAGRPVWGVLELNETLIVGTVFLALAWTWHQGGHVRVTLLISHFPSNGKSIANVTAMLISLFLFSLVAWRGALEVGTSLRIRETHWTAMGGGFPIWPARIALAVGASFFCVELVIGLASELLALSKKDRIRKIAPDS